MRRFPLRTLVPVALAVATVPLVPGCGDDEPAGPTTIVGSWAAASLTAPSQPQWGDAIQDDGLSVSIAFSANGTYSFTVANDDPADPWICPNQASCSWTGAYSTSGNTMVFDQGTVDEASATYSLSGNNLTITFAATAQIVNPYRIVLQPS